MIAYISGSKQHLNQISINRKINSILKHKIEIKPLESILYLGIFETY